MTDRDIVELIRFLVQTDVRELRLERNGERLEILRALPGGAPEPVVTQGAAYRAPDVQPALAQDLGPREVAGADDQLRAISSPLVGTFFRCPAPGKPAFVEVGSVVDAGATLCIVESMKVMNEIESDVKGRVARILVEDGQPVEYGQHLFLIEPIL
ncbi:MAG: acetyl-CoA carboxylase biotin carboxyl carrier protein [bacterium]